MQKRKVLSLECKSEGVMNDESGESMDGTGGESTTQRTGCVRIEEVRAWSTERSRELSPETRGSIVLLAPLKLRPYGAIQMYSAIRS